MLKDSTDSTWFSKQEVRCLQFLVRGMTAKMIAYQLGISSRTVESHLAKIKIKLNVYSKSELIAKVLEYDIVRLQWMSDNS